MKANTKKIVKALMAIKKYCQKKSFQNIKISFEDNCIVFYTTDHESSIRIKVLAEGDQVKGEYIIKVGPKVFLDYFKSISTKTVEFFVDDGFLSFDSFRVPIFLEEIYSPASFGGMFVEVDTEKMLMALEQTIYCASTDISRLALTRCELTIFNDKIKIAATDGYRLSVSEFNKEDENFPKKEVLISAEHLELLSHIINLSNEEFFQIVLADKGFFFVVNGDEFVIDIYLPFDLSSRFPDYRFVMREPDKDVITCIVNTEKISNALNKIKNLEKFCLKVRKDAITISDSDVESLIVENIPIESTCFRDYDGVDYTFKTKYIIDVVKTIKSKTCRFSFGEGQKDPLVVRQSNNVTLIMPMSSPKK